MKKRSIGIVSAAVGAMAAPAMASVEDVAGLGDAVWSPGGAVSVTVGPSEAGYLSDIRLFASIEGSPLLIANNREVGKTVDLGVQPAGELLFGIYVHNTGQTYFTGPASRNPDGRVHALVEYLPDSSAVVRFEDLWGGGDGDFNDVTFTVSNVVPTPGTAALVGAAVLLGSGRQRRSARTTG